MKLISTISMDRKSVKSSWRHWI